MFRSRILKAAATGVAAVLALSACGASPSSNSSGASQTIKVGALAVPAGDMLKQVQRELAPKEGLTVEYKEFSDYNTPNPALSDGDIDANLFQNTTFMETYNKASGKNLVSVGRSVPAADGPLLQQRARSCGSSRRRLGRHPE